MAIAWPASLPQGFLDRGLGLEDQPNAVAYKPAGGPPITRRRFTLDLEEKRGQMRLTLTQKDTLDSFYRDNKNVDIQMAGTFDETNLYRFASKPTYTPAAGGAEVIANIELRQVGVVTGTSEDLIDVGLGDTLDVGGGDELGWV